VREPRAPTDLGLGGKQTKRFVGSEKEAVTEVGGGLSCEVICLVVEVRSALGRTR
jgi:hypothetical protein